MLRLYIPTLPPFSNSYLRWNKTRNTCSRQNALMSTPFLLETREAFKLRTVWWFVEDVTVLGILYAHAQQTYRLQEHPRVTRITNAPIYPLPSHNIHGHRTPPISILNVLPIDQTTVDTILWDILINKMPSIPIPHRDHHSPSADWTGNKYHARRSNIPGQQHNYSNVIQNHALQDWQCLESGSLDNKLITILIDTGSSISLMDKQVYYSFSLVPPLQPTPSSVSSIDDKPLVALGKTAISIAINEAMFQVQLVVTRNVLFSEVLRIDFLRIHGWVISFPTNQLYLTNPSPKPVDSSVNTNHLHNTHTHHPCTHLTHTSHTHASLSTPNRPSPIISIEPVTIPARTNIIMTTPCAHPRSIAYLSHHSNILLTNQFNTHV